MELLSPTFTSPDTCAEGAIQLVLPTLGTLRLAATAAGMRVTAQQQGQVRRALPPRRGIPQAPSQQRSGSAGLLSSSKELMPWNLHPKRSSA